MNGNLRKLIYSIAAVVAIAYASTSHAAALTGAGATFPYPLYAKWANAYKKQTGIRLNYQSIGSGGGIKQIIAETIDFGATDAPMTPENQQKNGLTQFPTVIGGVVPVINLKGISANQLKLSSDILADIFLGKIKKWNDPQLVALNPDVKLPSKSIVVIHRADGSGTTFIFTAYLSQVSPAWKSTVGTGKAVSWKAGTGGKGNEGVASYVQRIKGSIGYVEYAYALQNEMTSVQLQNLDGQFVNPDEASFSAAATNAKWDASKGFYEVLTNQPGKNSWPITGATFILVYKTQSNAESGRGVLKFFDWAYSDKGDALSSQLGYVPLPKKVQDLIRTSWKEQIKDSSGKSIWK
jgi:phosphate transport system substrate-binding protein